MWGLIAAVRILQEGVLEPLMLLGGESMRDISVRFKACLTICNLAYHPQNRHTTHTRTRTRARTHTHPTSDRPADTHSPRRHLKEAKALDLVSSFIEPENWAEATEKTSIWVHTHTPQPCHVRRTNAALLHSPATHPPLTELVARPPALRAYVPPRPLRQSL